MLDNVSRIGVLAIGGILSALIHGGLQAAENADRAAAIEADVTQGALRIVEAGGKAGDAKAPGGEFLVVECPLKHTDVQVEIAGFLARVNVVQTFHNPLVRKIEAVYVFPLPNEAAVDAMTMVVGDRRVKGAIKRRQEARAIYEEALLVGHTAALLEQERPNIFTQSVGNIDPGQEVRIEISYVDVLKYDVGSYEFHFPMVVGPRYNPGGPIASPVETPKELAGKVAPPAFDTDRVPDASRISPPVLKPEFRTGHDVSLSVKLDAGVPIQDLTSGNHAFSVTRDGDRKAEVTLDRADSLPNKDFVLRYKVVGKKPEMAVLAHTGKHSADSARMGEGYFLLMIQPSEDEQLAKNPPREIVFLVNVSGSMSGEPTAKVKEAMKNMFSLCREKDTVQVVTFADQANKLFEKPLPATGDTIRRALAFTKGVTAGGGTEMIEGVRMAIDEPLDPERMRIVVMLTDGHIGNEAEIIEHVGKNCGDKVRFWGIGIGASPNMFLIDGVAAQGHGMGKRLGLDDDSVALTQEVMMRIMRDQLANISIDWNGLEVSETFPAKIPELWAGRPVMLLGRYRSGGARSITVHGTIEGESVEWPMNVELPARQPEHDSLAKAWARRKIEDLMQQSFYLGSPAVEEEVTAIALDYKLMSQYTSFVAVDPTMSLSEPAAEPPYRMSVPVPLPEGTLYEGFFGDGEVFPVADLVTAGISQLEGTTVQLPTLAVPRAVKAVVPPPRASSCYERQLAQAGRMPLLAGRGRMMSGGMGGFGGGIGAGMGAGMGMGGMPGGMAGMSGGAGMGSGMPSLPYSVSKPTYRRGLDTREFATAGIAGPAAVIDKRLTELKTLDDFESPLGAQRIGGQASSLGVAAQAALADARKRLKSESLDKAAFAFSRAYLLAIAAMNSGHYPDGQIASEALKGLNDVRTRQLKEYVKRQPLLETRLDVVLEDLSLAEAVAKIAEEAALPIAFVKGSEADALPLVGEHGLRVNYLDLRRATVAQALDWVLLPARLTWRVDKGELVAGSQRRLAGQSAWIYDVAAMALPAKADLDAAIKAGKLEDASPTVAARASLASFRSIAKAVSGLADDSAIAWHAPGKLLVFADQATHERMERFFADLADAKAKPEGRASMLHAKVTSRLASREDGRRRALAAEREVRIALALDQFGWPLLAAAAAGRLDREAFVELSIAWHHRQMTDLLGGEGRTLALASLWMISEASAALPGEKELHALARHAAELSKPAADEALGSLQEKSDDDTALTSVLFAALAERSNDNYRRNALAALSKRDEPSPLHTLANALLEDTGKIDRAALEKQINGGNGDDMLTALLALACRRAGSEVWDAFRIESHKQLGRQALRGEVVVLVSRLSASRPQLKIAQP